MEPFPIYVVSDHYFLYDIDIITHIRREHFLPGVLIGTLPQHPQQNVFTALPLQLLPEEARLLIEKGAAFLVDDTLTHRKNYLLGGLSTAEAKAFQKALDRQGRESAMAHLRRAEERKEKTLQNTSSEKTKKAIQRAAQNGTPGLERDDLLFSSPDTPRSPSVLSLTLDVGKVMPHFITPATSYPPQSVGKSVVLPTSSKLPAVPPSYPLFRYLHSRGYFLSPGPRFGSNYLAYPGDSMRYHAHFLAIGKGWDEEFALLDFVAGGRLGTGVKKGFCLGGEVVDESGEGTGEDRAFVIEWARM